MASAGATRISVRVTPRGGRNSIDGWDGHLLRIRVSAAPAGGAANEAVIKLLSKELSVPKSSITIASGSSSRTKLVEVEGASLAEIMAALGAPKR